MFRKRRLSSAIATISLLASHAVVNSVSAQERNWALEEVVITAQKREQSLNDVSIAVTAATSEDIRNFRVESAVDIAKIVPNVDIKTTLGGVANPAITVRGVGLNDFNVNNNPTVGVYVDEIFLTSPAMLSFMMFDVGRIEVLKGPQGTLYGRNTNGGAINIVTAKPTQELEGFVHAGYGDYNASELEAAISGPLSDSWAGRLSVRYDDRDGTHEWNQGDADFGALEGGAARGQLAYEGDTFAANLSLGVGHQEGSTVPGTAFGLQTTPGYDGNPLFGGEGCDANAILKFQCVDFDGFKRSSDSPYDHDLDQDAVKKSRELETDTVASNVTMNWELENVTVTSVTGYLSLERQWFEVGLDHDPSVSPYGTIGKDEKVEQFSQELRLSGGNDRVDWIVGAFYSFDDIEANNYWEVTNVAPINDPEFGLGGFDLAWGYDQETTAYALFAHTEWHLSEEFAVIAGLRYSGEDRDFFDAGSELAADGELIGFPLTSQDTNIDDDQFSGKLGVEYRPNDDWMLYASVSNGFKSGGFTGDFTFVQEEMEPFDSEELIAYETGFKATLAEGTAQLNGAVFYYDYSDIQTFIPLPTGAFPLTNADSASILGGELELAWRPLQGLDLRLGVGLLDHELDDDRLGDSLPNAADLQYNGLVRYEFDLFDGLMAAVQTDFKYTDAMYREALNDPILKTEGYTIWNGRVALLNDAASWEVAAWVKNITEEEYYGHGFDLTALNGTYMKFPGEPRTYGVSFSYYF